MLETFVNWVVTGPQDTMNSDIRSQRLKQEVSRLSRILIQSIKTKRQMQYSKASSTGFYQNKQTPFNVGLGLYIHEKTRSKELIDSLSQLNLCINYQKILRIETSIGNAVCDRIVEKNGIYVPPSVQIGHLLYFAVDNTDFRNNTCDGKNEFRGIIATVHQPCNNNSETPMLKINPHEKNRSLRNISLSERKYCMKPSPPNNIYISFTENNDKCTYYAFLDFLWFLCRTLASDKKVTQTWAAFNSLFSQNTSLTNITTLPLVQGTPTDWSNLCSV